MLDINSKSSSDVIWNCVNFLSWIQIFTSAKGKTYECVQNQIPPPSQWFGVNVMLQVLSASCHSNDLSTVWGYIPPYGVGVNELCIHRE
jgi:hypothetical protein